VFSCATKSAGSPAATNTGEKGTAAFAIPLAAAAKRSVVGRPRGIRSGSTAGVTGKSARAIREIGAM
jgi:hypothetical protein